MSPLAVAGSHAICLAVTLMSSRSAGRYSAMLLALASTDVPRPAAVTRAGRRVPVNVAAGRRSTRNGGSYRTRANCTVGPQPGNPSISEAFAVLSMGSW
jgi:hypothetical protein